MNNTAAELVGKATTMKARNESLACQHAATVWRTRWLTMLSVSVHDALAAALVDEGLTLLDAPGGSTTDQTRQQQQDQRRQQQERGQQRLTAWAWLPHMSFGPKLASLAHHQGFSVTFLGFPQASDDQASTEL